MKTHLTDGNALLPFRLGAMMVGSFGVLGLVLATIGIYGVIAYSVGSRTHEFGVRMALGADRRSVLNLVLREGLILTFIGTVFGVLLAVPVSYGMGGLLLDVNPMDGVVYASVTASLIIIAIVACLIPARRATKVDPMVALRYE